MSACLSANDLSVLDYVFARDHGYAGPDKGDPFALLNKGQPQNGDEEEEEDRWSTVKVMQARAVGIAEEQHDWKKAASILDDALEIVKRTVGADTEDFNSEDVRILRAALHNDRCQLLQLEALSLVKQQEQAEISEETKDASSSDDTLDLATSMRRKAMQECQSAIDLCQLTASTDDVPFPVAAHKVASRALSQRALLRELLDNDQGGATKDFFIASKMGSQLAIEENVRRNPVAKLCHAMVKQGLEANSWD